MRILIVSVFILAADQITKLSIKGISIPFLNINTQGMIYGESFDVFGSFFRITFVENPGMAFGIGVGELGKLFLTLFSLIASIGLFIYLQKLKDDKFLVRFALALILGGALGNLIDRAFYGVIYGYAPILYGHVVDFLDVDFFDFSIMGKTYNRWPIFNIADTAVTLGVILLIFTNSLTKSESEAAIENELIDIDVAAEDSRILAEDSNEILVQTNKDKLNSDQYQNEEKLDGKDNNRESIND